MRTTAIALGILLVATGCSKPPPGQSTSAGDLKVDLALSPDPPTTGDNRLLVTLHDASGKPVDGARLRFRYLMAAMGQMPEMKGGGTTQSLGSGRYSISYPLQMNGDWTLTLGIEAPGHAPTEVRVTVSPPRRGFTLRPAALSERLLRRRASASRSTSRHTGSNSSVCVSLPQSNASFLGRCVASAEWRWTSGSLPM